MLTADNLQTGAPALEASYCVASSVERGRLVDGPGGGAGKHVDGVSGWSSSAPRPGLPVRSRTRSGWSCRGCGSALQSWLENVERLLRRGSEVLPIVPRGPVL